MRYKWRPRQPARSRAGALGFIFILLLFAAIAVLLFQLNPVSRSAGVRDLLGNPTDPPTIVPASSATAVPPPVATPGPHVPALPWQMFLPLVSS